MTRGDRIILLAVMVGFAISTAFAAYGLWRTNENQRENERSLCAQFNRAQAVERVTKAQLWALLEQELHAVLPPEKHSVINDYASASQALILEGQPIRDCSPEGIRERRDLPTPTFSPTTIKRP